LPIDGPVLPVVTTPATIPLDVPQDAAVLALSPPAFQAEQIIQAAGADLRVDLYSVPELADWDNDALGAGLPTPPEARPEVSPAAQTWTATVDYDDGAGPVPLTLNPDKTFALNHQYTVPGTYTVTVTVTDDEAAEGTDTLLVTVTDVDPTTAVVLGPSDNIALDQPRVAVELLTDAAGTASVGPSIFNTFLLDTGANSVLAMATAVNDMIEPPVPYVTEGEFVEQGVAGDHPMDISAAYRLDFAGTSGIRHTLDDARILSDADNDFSMFGPWGIAGMPAMANRVTTLDMTGWSGGGLDLDGLYMNVDFADEVPPDEGHRYSVPLDNRLAFDVMDGVVSGDPPVWADVPFLTAIPTHNGVGQEGNFLLDTGAQISAISRQLAIDVGLDSNVDGELGEGDDAFVGYETISGWCWTSPRPRTNPAWTAYSVPTCSPAAGSTRCSLPGRTTGTSTRSISIFASGPGAPAPSISTSTPTSTTRSSPARGSGSGRPPARPTWARAEPPTPTAWP